MKTTRLSRRIFSVTFVLCMLVGTIGVMPISVFATEICTCSDRCYLNDIDANCTVCTNSDFSGCMGTPELVENGSPWRLSDASAEVNFMGTVNPNVIWKYFYIVTNDATAQPTASEIIASGKSGDYSDPCTLVLDNLAEGEKYIHIVLRQEEQDRTTNVLRLTIPAFVELTITPSANGGDYDVATNTLTIKGGGTVKFALNAPGYVHCDNDETIEATPVGDDPENATEWTVTLPTTPNTYTFYYGLGGQEAWCTVVVEDEILPTTCTLTFDYSIPNENEIEIGAGIADKTAKFESGTVVDLSEFWPDKLTYDIDGTTYYFAGFTKKDDIKILDSVAVDSNIVLEAAWVTQEKITITFETQGGDLFGGTRKSRVNKGCDFGTLNGFHIPTREDYVFTGWCLKSIGLPENDLTKLTEDTTVYAIWQWNRQPESAWWSTNVKGKAEWTPVDGIDGYIVTLYEAESGSRIRSKVVSNDVSEYTFDNPVIFDENKNFYFTVMACLGNLKSYETKSNESKPFAIASIDGAVDSMVTVIKADGEISVPVKVINQGGNRVALTDDVFAFIGKEIDVPVANADKIAISKTAIKWNLGITDEEAEITLEEAKVILADWREIVNTAEGEEQIKSLLPDYSIYELALLIQANNIIGPDDDTEEKLNRLINDERERQKEAGANTQISFGETKVAMDAEALLSIEKALSDGEYVAISAEKIDVTGLADDEVLFDEGILTGAGIFTKEELLDLKVIDENNGDITWNELKYLYHYMTITELKSLGWFIEDFLYNTDPQVLVWLDEMIERDTIKPLNMQELMDMADLTDDQFELLADADLNDPPIGHLRQADLTVEQMRRLYSEVRILIGELNDNDKLRNCNELLGWLDDAIAAKEWEADKSQTQPSLAYTAKETAIGGVNIDFVAVKAIEPFADTDGITHYSVFISEGIFTYNELSEFGVFGGDDESISWGDMKLLYHYMTKEDLGKLKNRFSGGSEDLKPFVDWLDKMIERDEFLVLLNQVQLKESGIWDKLIETKWDSNGALPLKWLRRINLSTKQLEYIKEKLQAIISENEENQAVLAWVNEAIAAKNWQPKTPVVASGELAYTIPVNSNFDLSKGTVRAYKVADDGSLNIKKVVVNADGTVTIQSDSNSTYIVTYEPAKASEEHTHTFEWKIDKEATETEDGIKHEECACGEKRNENTVIPKTGTTEPDGLSTGAIVAIVIACVVVLAGGGSALYLFVFKKKKA